MGLQLQPPGDPAITPLCRHPIDPTQFCQFARTCNEARQELQHRYHLVGENCWAYCLLTDRARLATLAAPPSHGSDAPS